MKKDTKLYRVLIVEDNPGDFALAEDFLFEQILNPVIAQAVSFKQAFEIISTEGTPFDIILLDLSLPDKNGNDLITSMLKIASSCPIIILTGYTDVQFSIKSLGRGILDYLLKDEMNASLLYRSIIYSIEIKKHILEIKESDQKVTKAIIKAQENERQEISSELHDNVCQILLVSKLNLDMLKEFLPPEGMKFFDKCTEYISSALNETRNLSHRLSPLFFDDTTLEDSFKRLLNMFNIEKEIEFVLKFDSNVNKHPISPELKLNLYRILQEQLKNILKYAKANVVEIDVFILNNTLKVKIADNGIGFNIVTVKEGIGIANMKRRVELFSGIFEVESSPGRGCIVKIDMPLNEIIRLN